MKLTKEQQQAYDWAIKQSYPSVAATYAKILAGVITQLESELAGMVLMEAESERFAEDIVAENERLRHHVRRLMDGYDPENLTMQSVYYDAKKALGGEG